MNLQLLAKQLKANAYAAMDSDLKLARGMAHAKFDLIWQRKLMTRRKAYLWLQEVMQMTEAQAHMEHMDATQCMQVIDQVNKTFPWLR
jgi:hypothetical protein